MARANWPPLQTLNGIFNGARILCPTAKAADKTSE